MSGAAVFSVRGLVKRFGGLVVTDNVSLDLHDRQVHALIGPNGAGKSTLVNLISGLLRPDSGSLHLEGVDITAEPAHWRAHRGLARCFQITSIFRQATVLENLLLSVQAASGSSFGFVRERNSEADLVRQATALARRVSLHNDLDRPAGTLAHGAQRRLDLALALASKPLVLLLDEPMAGMGPDESQELVPLLRDLRENTAILLVEHDMDAVFKLADQVTVLVQGRVFASGTPHEIRSNPQVQAVYLGTELATHE